MHFKWIFISLALLLHPLVCFSELTFEGKWTSQYMSSLHQSDSEDKKSTLQSIAQVAAIINPKWAIQGTLGFNEALTPASKFDLIDPEFRAFYQLVEFNPTLKTSLGPTFSLPLSRDAQNASLIASLGVAARTTFGGDVAVSPHWTIYYDLGLNRNFHQYQTSLDGSQNITTSLEHLMYFEYRLNDQWYSDASFGFSSAWMYSGTVSNSTLVEQEVGVHPTQHTSIMVAHTRGGDFLSPSGQSYQFSLFDANESRLSLRFSYLL